MFGCAVFLESIYFYCLGSQDFSVGCLYICAFWKSRNYSTVVLDYRLVRPLGLSKRLFSLLWRDCSRAACSSSHRAPNRRPPPRRHHRRKATFSQRRNAAAQSMPNTKPMIWAAWSTPSVPTRDVALKSSNDTGLSCRSCARVDMRKK